MILEVRNIEKSFGNFKALEDVSFGVREGSVFGLLGPNGAGKTTMIRIINRIIRADRGELLLSGKPITDEMVRSIGYLPEERGLYKKMRVGEQAIYLAQLKGLSRYEATSRLRFWFDKFEITDWWNRPVEQLSKGMQQKVQFIVTVLHEPHLLIFDEPFSGFDPVNATLLKNEILELRRKGATIILSTHNMASVEELCDDIALINSSHVVLSGSVNEIRRSYSRNLFEVVVDNGEVVQISPSRDEGANELLAELMKNHRIVSFREILPSMNDIFVEKVLGKEAKQ
ncbi:MAG: ATP-binding cassette domain-containing protein [Bacteroidales bacterium]|nr:ATP-binding cassette domain-containing protein [Bacteroidales bacterium]